MKKAFLAASLVGLGLFSSGCLGPNKLFNDLHEWNEGVSETDWINEAVFLTFTIIPVYGIAYWIDILILNTVEYWGGDD